jgi:hypothetical protein
MPRKNGSTDKPLQQREATRLTKKLQAQAPLLLRKTRGVRFPGLPKVRARPLTGSRIKGNT